MRAAVAELPEDLRSAVILSEDEDLTHAEIAAIAGCSAKAVETRLYRARAILAREALALAMRRSALSLPMRVGLPKSGVWLFSKPVMRPFSVVFAIALALLFVFSTNRCAIAAAFPGEIEECCPGEKSSGESERGLPCGGKDCAPCATLESGVHPSSLVPLTITAPVWTEDEDFAELMRRLAAAAVGEVSAAPPDPAAIPPPPWCDVMMKALPVRAPSLVA